VRQLLKNFSPRTLYEKGLGDQGWLVLQENAIYSAGNRRKKGAKKVQHFETSHLKKIISQICGKSAACNNFAARKTLAAH
jgi:hypothetical protein